MNSFLQLCPKCNNNSKMSKDKDIIHFNCQCGYHSTINIEDYIHENKQYNSISENAFKVISKNLIYGNEHLLNYFMTLKKNHISQLTSTIEEIESSYKESYRRNKNMLSFIQILIDNYDGSTEMKNYILDTQINIYECKDSSNSNEVIKYYKNYNIMKRLTLK